MKDFNHKLKTIVEYSYSENIKSEKTINHNIIKNNSVYSFFKINNNILDYLILRNKNKIKNNNINNINNTNNNMSLYKKYKKYNSIYNKPKNCRNILNKFKSNENSYSSTKNYLFYPLNTHIKNLKSLYNDNHDKKCTLTNYTFKNSYNNNNHNNHNIKNNNYFNKLFSDSKNNFKEYSSYYNKDKYASNRVKNGIIQKIELIENENKENKVKNLLINRPPRNLDKDVFKFDLKDFSYLLPTSRYNKDSKEKKNSRNKNINKHKYKNDLFNLDNLSDIIFEIKIKKIRSTSNKTRNKINN